MAVHKLHIEYFFSSWLLDVSEKLLVFESLAWFSLSENRLSNKSTISVNKRLVTKWPHNLKFHSRLNRVLRLFWEQNSPSLSVRNIPQHSKCITIYLIFQMTKFIKRKARFSPHRHLKVYLNDRKIGCGPVKKGVPTSHSCSCELYVSCFLRWVRIHVFFAIDVYGPQNRKISRVPTSYRLTSACIIISLIECTVP